MKNNHIKKNQNNQAKSPNYNKKYFKFLLMNLLIHFVAYPQSGQRCKNDSNVCKRLQMVLNEK